MSVITPPAPHGARCAARSGRRLAPAGHLWQIDVVRLLTFSAVIVVHALAFTEQPSNRVAAGMMMLLQYGREVFFALTGFVLVYTMWDRPLRLGDFWRKRVLCVALPYFTWSVVYYLYLVLGPPHLAPTVAGFVEDIAYGGAMYHLYFLLVTLQLYLAFPVILWFVRRTSDRPVLTLGIVSGFNISWLAWLQYTQAPGPGPANWLYVHAYELLPSYAMYVLAGCYAAVHLSRVERVVAERPRLLLAGAALAGAAAVGAYMAQLSFMDPRTANDVLQPAMVFSCLAAVIVVYLIGAKWAAGPRRHQKAVEILSDASFGLYLAHPLVLVFLLDYAGFGNQHPALPAPLATVLAVVIAAVGGTLLSLAARWTPLSLALTGRPQRRTAGAAAVAVLRSFDLRPRIPAVAFVPGGSALLARSRSIEEAGSC